MKLEYTAVTDLQWANESHSAITMTVNFKSLGEVPFTASPDDAADHGRELFARAVAGDFGNIYPADQDDVNDLNSHSLRQLLDNARIALSTSDATLLRCYEVGIALPAEWVAYRKALREVIRAGVNGIVMEIPNRPSYPVGT
ncbi:hypothetical protein [Aquitalea aquatilis]|uniref:hypothetical protein n=1 Tax=Aquitalea aquatilis TaxID=1537400 RepID=UPI0010BD9E6C|nr:hypothetical protein [Aquitalea aquatilis]